MAASQPPVDGLPADLAEAVTNFAGAISCIEELVEKLRRAPWAELCRDLAPLESARLHLMVAYTINTLFYSAQLPIAPCALLASSCDCISEQHHLCAASCLCDVSAHVRFCHRQCTLRRKACRQLGTRCRANW